MINAEDGNSKARRAAHTIPSKRFRLATLGAAVLLVTGCANESVSPMGAASAVDPMAAAAMAASRPADETAVVNFRQEEHGPGVVEVSWEPPTYTSERLPLRDYQVRVDWEKWRSIPATASRERFTGVDGRRYRHEIRARFGDADNGFNGKKSTIYATAAGSAPGAPDAPQDLKSKLLGNDNVRLTWKVADTGGEAHRWEIEIRSGVWVSTGGDRPRFTYGPHRAGVTRSYKVRGANSHGTGPVTIIEVTREDLSSTPPGVVQNFTWTPGSRNNEYILSWDRPANFDSDDPITAYRIYVSDNCALNAYLQPYRPSGSQVSISISVFVGFGAGEQKDFAIRATNSAGTGACQTATRG
ncbi:MAG: hypothetical protein F4029_02320 [Gammaproteobacteria bacterium]|nr:hypothetical protein [Gemmatimonadales bacterium]MYF28790.1 hypothetical protein [Gammaproteobacteria bacterium]MYK45044.1 hypothetical protein [Gammaproteobacteria bacterium]